MQKKNGRAVSITTSYPLNTRDVPIRQHFKRNTYLKVVRSEMGTAILRYLEEMPLALILKIGNCYLSKSERTLEQET